MQAMLERLEGLVIGIDGERWTAMGSEETYLHDKDGSSDCRIGLNR